jgi:type II secretory pathway component PulF
MSSPTDPMLGDQAPDSKSDAARIFRRIRRWAFLVAFYVTVLAAAFGAGLCCMFTIEDSPGLLIPGGFCVVILACIAPLAAYAYRGRTQREALAVVALLDQAIRLNTPLDPMLGVAEASNRGTARDRIVRFRSMLSGGAPIGEALRHACPELSARQIALVLSGERMERLSVVLPMVLGENRAPRPVGSRLFSWYPLGMLVVLGAVVPGFMVFIVPKFRDIFADFHAALPWPTELLMAAFDSQWVFWLVGIPFCAAVAIALMMMPSISAKPRRNDRPQPLTLIVDPIAWRTPLVGAMLQNQGLADVCDLLAVAIDASYPADAALGHLADVPANRVLRQRIHHWSAGVHGGLSLDAAARAAHLPDVLVSMLATSGSGSPAPALRFLASYYRLKFSKVAALLSAATGPVSTMVIGALVGLVALATFMPLIRLIDAVARTVPSF